MSPLFRVPQPAIAGTARGDRQLMRAAALGDVRAWDLLVDHYAEVVWHIARRLGLPRPAAEDVCAVVWLRLAQRLPYEAGMPLVQWLREQVVDQAHQSLLMWPDAASGRAITWDGVERRHQARC